MTIAEITEQIKLIKNNYVNGMTTTEEIIEELEDLIHTVEGNDGLDGLSFESDDEYYDSFETVDFTQLEV